MKIVPLPTIRGAVRAAALLALAGGLLGQHPALTQAAASPIPFGSKNRCDPAGPISLGFFDVRSLTAKAGSVAVSYERTSSGLPQRTIFLKGDGYVISVCQPSGAFREERYERVVTDEDPVAVSIADVEPDGTSISVDFSYVGRETSRNAGKLSAADRRKILTPPSINEGDVKIASEAQALKTRNLKPGRRSNAEEYPGAEPLGPIVAPAYYAANKCIHNSGVNLGRLRSPRSFTYYSGLGSFYDLMVISGSRAFPDVWNYCGWTVGSGLSAVLGGYVGAFSNLYDGVNTIGWSTICGPGKFGCNYTHQAWDSTLGAVRIFENDIAIDPTVPYANGAVAGHLDFQSAIAHEVGHSWGFGDFYNDPWAENHVMYGVLPDGVDDRRYLAYGDYQIMRSMYP